MSESEQNPSRRHSRDVQRALAHPIRARLLTELQGRAASPSELAPRVDESVGVVSYHVRALAEAGLVELVGTVPRRGALQHFYQAVAERPVGATLKVSAAAADRLREEIALAIERARKSPGSVDVVVVAHQ